jgi:hypothetical protein
MGAASALEERAMNPSRLPVILGLVIVIASSRTPPAFSQEGPETDFYNRAFRQLAAIDRDAQVLRDQALRELNGKEFFNRGLDPRGPFLKHTADLLERWFKEPLQNLKQAAAGLEADRADLRKPGTRMTLDEFHAKTYRRIGDALDILWTLERRVAGGAGWGEPGGRNAVFWAVNLRAYDARLKTWEEERAKLDRNAKEYRANLAAIEERLRKEETETWMSLARPYREMALRLRDARRRIAGEVWLWQDIAFRRSAVKGDEHDKAADAFRTQVYDRFGWDRNGRGLMDQLRNNTVLEFRQVTNFFTLDSKPDFGDIRPGSNPWGFFIRGLLEESVESLRRTDDHVPAVQADGTPLEQYVKQMHARLQVLRSLAHRIEQVEHEMARRCDRLEVRELLRDRLSAWRMALDAYVDAAVPARNEASLWNDADVELKRNEAEVDARAAALEKVKADVAAIEKELRVRSGEVVRSSDAKTGPTFADVVKKLEGKIDTLRQNPTAPNAKERIKEHEDELKNLRGRRDDVLKPARERLQNAEKALGAAKEARDRSAEALRKTRKPEDRSVRLKELHAAVAAARADAVGSDTLKAALAETGTTPAELPAFQPDAALGSIIKAAIDARQAVADAVDSVEKTIDPLLEELRRDLSDYQALGRYQAQLGREVALLRRDAAMVARNTMESAAGDPVRDPVIVELDKLLKKLDKVLNAFDSVGKLYPERVDFLAEPAEARNVGLDEVLRKTTDKVALVGRVLKKAKKVGELVITAEELRRRLKNNDPQALATMLKVVGDHAELVPVIGDVVAMFVKFYADGAEATIGKIKDLQKKIIEGALLAHFHDEGSKAPEQRLYTVDDLKEIVGSALQNTDGAGEKLKQLALLYQSRRLLYLTGAGPHAQIGLKP